MINLNFVERTSTFINLPVILSNDTLCIRILRSDKNGRRRWFAHSRDIVDIVTVS